MQQPPAASPSGEPELEQVIWVSAAKRLFTPEELVRLLTRSRAANQAREITGLLLYHRQSFLQLMEGPTDKIEFVFENRIMTDSRHTDVTVLLRRSVTTRNFPDWSMGFVETSIRPIRNLPGFHNFQETQGCLLDLRGDHEAVDAILAGFHDGRWHKDGEHFL